MIVSGVATGTKLILNEVDPAEKFRAVFGSQTRLLQCRSLLVGRWRRGALLPGLAFPAGREAQSGPQWLHEIKLDGY
jgi:hypothetical protein